MICPVFKNPTQLISEFHRCSWDLGTHNQAQLESQHKTSAAGILKLKIKIEQNLNAIPVQLGFKNSKSNSHQIPTMPVQPVSRKSNPTHVEYQRCRCSRCTENRIQLKFSAAASRIQLKYSRYLSRARCRCGMRIQAGAAGVSRISIAHCRCGMRNHAGAVGINSPISMLIADVACVIVSPSV